MLPSRDKSPLKRSRWNEGYKKTRPQIYKIVASTILCKILCKMGTLSGRKPLLRHSATSLALKKKKKKICSLD